MCSCSTGAFSFPQHRHCGEGDSGETGHGICDVCVSKVGIANDVMQQVACQIDMHGDKKNLSKPAKECMKIAVSLAKLHANMLEGFSHGNEPDSEGEPGMSGEEPGMIQIPAIQESENEDEKEYEYAGPNGCGVEEDDEQSDAPQASRGRSVVQLPGRRTRDPGMAAQSWPHSGTTS